MSDFRTFNPTFKIMARNEQEANEINSFLTHILNFMPYETQLKAANKVNHSSNPAQKVKKISGGIKFL